MKYTIQIWLFTVISSPFLLALVLGIMINESELNAILDAYAMLFIMILFGLFLSLPAMAVFWLIQRSLKPTISAGKQKIILSIYSFLSVWMTFYVVDSGFVTRGWDQITLVLIYALTIALGVWIFKYPSQQRLNSKRDME